MEAFEHRIGELQNTNNFYALVPKLKLFRVLYRFGPLIMLNINALLAF